MKGEIRRSNLHECKRGDRCQREIDGVWTCWECRRYPFKVTDGEERRAKVAASDDPLGRYCAVHEKAYVDCGGYSVCGGCLAEDYAKPPVRLSECRDVVSGEGPCVS